MSEAINLIELLFIDEFGMAHPITNMFDADGDDCEAADAVSFVAGSGGTWFSRRVDDFEDRGVKPC